MNYSSQSEKYIDHVTLCEFLLPYRVSSTYKWQTATAHSWLVGVNVDTRQTHGAIFRLDARSARSVKLIVLVIDSQELSAKAEKILSLATGCKYSESVCTRRLRIIRRRQSALILHAGAVRENCCGWPAAEKARRGQSTLWLQRVSVQQRKDCNWSAIIGSFLWDYSIGAVARCRRPVDHCREF